MISAIEIGNIVIYVLMGTILVRVLLSWIVPIQPSIASNPIITFVFQITEPILAPIRRVLPAMGMLDLSPMVALLLLSLLKALLNRLA
ncbi:MAG: YggT family protein [Chloroflexota bacterium]|nr:YggT family protein [Chloroflexota bacterium]